MDITTLIPAFKPRFFPQLLVALKQQSHPPTRVLISDDSPEQVFVSAVRQIEGTPLSRKLNISVVPGPRQGGLRNLRHLLDIWAGQTELFHFLCDDDLIYPEFYRWHVAAQGAGYKCTVSRRWTSDESGQPLASLHEPDEVRCSTQSVLRLPAEVLFPSVVASSNNWFGEISNVVMHRDLAELYRDLTFEGIAYNGLDDIGTFLRASTKAPLGFITHYLGLFRRHAEQNTANQNRRIIKQGHVAWLALALASERAGYVTHEQAWQCIAHVGHHTQLKYASEPDMASLCQVIAPLMKDEPGAVEAFLDTWAQFVSDQPATPAKSMTSAAV